MLCHSRRHEKRRRPEIKTGISSDGTLRLRAQLPRVRDVGDVGREPTAALWRRSRRLGFRGLFAKQRRDKPGRIEGFNILRRFAQADEFHRDAQLIADA